jgi:hypothetical protein
VTKPLRDDLWSNENASWGYDFSDFCTEIGWPLRRWQHRLAVRLGELYPDGSPRYRKAIILIARQNGKTVFVRLLILFWMFVERVGEIIATSTDRSAAKRSWRKVIRMAEAIPLLAAELPTPHTRETLAEEDFWNVHDSHYRFAAPNRRAGRGDTVNRGVFDELREHLNRDAWDALVPAMNAVEDALLICISNEGDANSVVLHEEYDVAETYALTGEGDERTFLAAWSAPAGAAPDDVDALAYANPSLGDGLVLDALLGQARVAVEAGGETLARFRIEMLCQRVDLLEAAISIDAWNECGVPRDRAVDMAPHRRSVAMALDVAWDASHATLAAAVTLDGVTHIEIVKAWNGYSCRRALRAELPALLARYKPRKCVWIAGGPAAAVADEWSGRRVSNVLMEPLRPEDTKRAVMGLEEQVTAGHVRHTFDPLAEAQIRQTQRLDQGDGWVFARRGKAPIDCSYAVAAAVHAARLLPKLGPAT